MWFVAFIASFIAIGITLWFVHEIFCWIFPPRRARNHWPRTGHGHHYFSTDKRMYPDEF